MKKLFLLFCLFATSLLHAASITFQVNMSNETVSPNGVHIAGSFQGWNPSGTPLMDQGNGIWSVTLTIPNNTNHEYKFINGDSWGNDENVVGGCATNGNRTLAVGTQNQTLPIVCFNSCNNCPGAPRDITFQVDMSLQSVSPNGVHIAGSFQGWNPGTTQLTHIGNGVYSVSVSIPALSSIQYKFINGNSWGSDESVPGACNQGGNRYYSVPDNNATLPIVCFGQCVACPTNNVDITFQVDMSQQAVSPNGVHVAGSFQGWSPGTTQLTHQGNGIYSVTVPVQENTSIQYKFVNGNSWGNDESVPSLCATGGNRTFNVGTSNASIPLVCYNSCTTCPPASQNYDITFSVDMSQQTVSSNGVHIAGSFQGWDPAATPLTHVGNGIYEVTVSILENTTVQYKFINGNTFMDEEVIVGSCTTGGNRTFNVGSADASVPLVCFTSCTICPGLDKNITFQVDMSQETVSPNGVHIAGSFQGWDPAASPMTHVGNGIYQITFSIAENASVQYKFVNGNSWGSDESVPGACATGGNRGYTVGSSDATLPLVCYASCIVCPGPPVDVTFTVNMSQQNVSPNGVHVAGNFQGWNPAGTPLTHIGNGIYQVIVSVPSNYIAEYKFINGNSWGDDESVPGDCGGGNRFFTIGTSDVSIPTVCFSACFDCSYPMALLGDMCGRTDLIIGGTPGATNQMRVTPTGSSLDRYHYLIADASGFNILGQITRRGINTRVRFGDYPAIFQAGNTYTIRVVRAEVNVPPTFNNVAGCQISFPVEVLQTNIPTTKIINSGCSLNSYVVDLSANSNANTVNGVNHLNAEKVLNASSYDFQIMDVNNQILGVISSNYHGRIFLGNHPTVFSYGNTYKVIVRAHIGNVVGNYGDTCTISTIDDPNSNPPAPTTIADCNLMNVNAGTRILRNNVLGASSYTYLFYTDAFGVNLYTTATVMASRVLFAGDITPGLLPNTTYYVGLSANVGGVNSTVASLCTLTTEAPAPRLANSKDFEINAFPNPFVNSVSVSISSKESNIATLNIYDIAGKLISNRQVSTNQNIEIGSNLAAGHYILEAIQPSGQKATFRLVKTN